MLPLASLVPLVLLATEAAANPVIARDSSHVVSVPIAKHIDLSAKFNVVQKDQVRLTRLTVNQADASTSGSTPSVPLADNVFFFVATVGIGNPETNYNLVLDTSSANTWVGANQPYKKTKTSIKTSNSVKVNYGSAFFEGDEYLDTLTIAPGVSIGKQSIGIASDSNGFQPYDGVLAIGPKGLTNGTLSPNDTSVISTVTDNLFKQKKIENNFVSVCLQPTTSTSAVTGELMFGGIDSTRITGDPTSFPLTNTSLAGDSWGIDASFRYGDGNSLMAIPGSGIFDSGLSLIYVDTSAFSNYVKATGATVDGDTGLLSISTDQYNNLESLFLEIGDSEFELTRNAQIWPRALNGIIGGKTDGIYLVVQQLGEALPGFNFILGTAFMERYCTVFDTAGKHVGIAKTPYTDADTN